MTRKEREAKIKEIEAEAEQDALEEIDELNNDPDMDYDTMMDGAYGAYVSSLVQSGIDELEHGFTDDLTGDHILGFDE